MIIWVGGEGRVWCGHGMCYATMAVDRYGGVIVKQEVRRDFVCRISFIYLFI